MSELEIVDPKDITGVKFFTAGHQTTPTTIPKLSDQAKDLGNSRKARFSCARTR